MQCKDCKNFKPDINLEASQELSFDKNCISGKCGITSSTCASNSKCSCNGFTEKCR
ncbi:MAG: hypothetical protein PWR27_1045 [Petroclostridium sp.]|jgi:hypothetical protein|nr:hypothetical protein [Clostridia bacterium]MDK2810336.1 hypothetical protein [Petroclostridium sp.]